MKRKIWYALVQVEATRNNKALEDAKGAFVNVAYRASSKTELLEVIENTFQDHDFRIVGVDDISVLTIDNADNPEKISLLKDVESDYDFSWGDFHTYME